MASIWMGNSSFGNHFLTDYAQPSDEDMVWSIWQENTGVKRLFLF